MVAGKHVIEKYFFLNPLKKAAKKHFNILI